jgi:hypothetical protein
MTAGTCLEQKALEIDAPEVAAVLETCRQHQIYAVTGLFERCGDKFHNNAFLAGPVDPSSDCMNSIRMAGYFRSLVYAGERLAPNALPLPC